MSCPREVSAHLPEAMHPTEAHPRAAEVELARPVVEAEAHLQTLAEGRWAVTLDPMVKRPDSERVMEWHPDPPDFPSTFQVV